MTPPVSTTNPGYTLTISHHVATLTFDSPSNNNAVSESVVTGMTADIRRLGTDPDVRTIVLTSNLRGVFSSGGDVAMMNKFFEAQVSSQQANGTFAIDYWLKAIDLIIQFLQAIRECPRPVISRVQGIAFGNAVIIVALSDVSIALASSLFCFPEVRHGFAPVTLALASIDKIGSGPLMAWGLSAERYSAEEARVAGVVTKVVSRMDELDAEVDRYVTAFKKNSPEAMAAYKAGVNRLLGLDFHKLQATARDGWFRGLTAHPLNDIPILEGLRSFRDQRKARWDVS